MDINKILMEYDNMFGENTLEEIDEFLSDKISEAMQSKEYEVAITLMNEMVGLCRDTSQYEKGLSYCDMLLKMMDNLGLKGSVGYATTLLNIGNAYRAFGKYKKSLEMFKEAEEIYSKNYDPKDFQFASLYNNWSLLYQEVGDFESARTLLKKAILIVDCYPEAKMEQASSRVNLAATELRICQDIESKEMALEADESGSKEDEEKRQQIKTYKEEYERLYKEATKHLKGAMEIYEADGGKDVHYSAALSSMGDALFMKEQFIDAANYYKKAMVELEKNFGKNDAYARVEEYYNHALKYAEIEEQMKKQMAGELAGKNGDVDLVENVDTKSKNGSKYVASVENSAGVENSTSVENSAGVKNSEVTTSNYMSRNGNGFHNNIARSKAFYEEYGVPMIAKMFGEYANRIAVGVCGEGSDCFGFEDGISTDHDYGVGFSMWLTEEDFEKIGISLNVAYDNLIAEYAERFLIEHGEKALADSMKQQSLNGVSGITSKMGNRRGATTIGAFYENLLGVKLCENRTYLPENMWLSIEEEHLAAATNGEVFVDTLGVFSNVRENLFKYYPRKVWLLRLAKAMHEFSQNGQSNYARMMARKDYVTANLCIANASKAAMQIAYLMNRTFAPYYKWMYRGMSNLFILRDLYAPLEELATLPCQENAWIGEEYSNTTINHLDDKVCIIERMAIRILEELRVQEIVEGTDTFLDSYVSSLMEAGMAEETTGGESRVAGSAYGVSKKDTVQGNSDADMNGANMSEKKIADMEKSELVDAIVKEEWQQFDVVKNEGGRASCQDDYPTFSIMRKSQYLAWDEELLKSYLIDLREASAKGWNLIMEKYGRMEKSTCPEHYREIEPDIPVRSEEREVIAEEIIKIQVAWMEEFAEKYPKMAGNARSIHTSEDNEFNTSYETYLRGELGTYSEETFVLYGRFIVSLQKAEKNLAYIIMNNTAQLYGYRDVADAEAKM